MFVTKRNNQPEPIHFDKITTRISKLLNEDEVKWVEPVVIAQKVIASIYNGITTKELDIESAKICANMSTLHPMYSVLGGRILASNLEKNTIHFGGFVNKYLVYQEKYGHLNEKWLSFIKKYKALIEESINYGLDYKYDYFGFKTIENAYLLKYEGQVFERPQDLLMVNHLLQQLNHHHLLQQVKVV
jgi:ribonucleoside-diphosphate reductase alpha chain